jgi:ribosomal protein L16 Arg81 hydroxylase
MKNNRAVSLPMPMIQINRKRSVPANVYFKHYVEKYEAYKHEKEEKERELEEEQYRKRLEYIATRYQNIKPKLQEKLRTNENFKNKFVNALKDMKNANHDTTLVTDENIDAQVERIGTYSILREYNLLKHLKGGMRKKTRKHKRKTTKRRFTQRR